MKLSYDNHRRKSNLTSHLKNERGVALIIAIFAMVLTVIITTEIAYETRVEFVGSSQALNRIKAYYAAKAGVELSLYRILLYKKAMALFADQVKTNKSMLDPIWQLPFAWPPTQLAELGGVDKGQMEDIVNESKMEAQYLVSINSEGGKIDINDLGSENKALAEGAKRQLLQIFENELERNEKFKKKYENYNFEKLIGYIKDWVDEDNTGENGDESIGYEQPREAKNLTFPPNAPFKTVAELHMVRDMEDAFFELLKDKITVYGTKGINVNYCPKELLEALDPQIKEEKLEKILKRRDNPKEGGPFADENDFYGFLENIGVRTQTLKNLKMPLLFDAEYNFRIRSIGMSGNVQRKIEAVVFDVDNLTSRYSEILDQARIDKGGAGSSAGSGGGSTGGASGGSGGGTTPPKIKSPKGRPTVVFWQET